MSFAEVSRKIDLTNKVAIITGGANGIGASTARAFAREGAYVVIGDVNPYEDTVNSMKRDGKEVVGTYCDVTNPEDVENLTALTLDEFGKVDILVTSAGICDRSNFASITLEKWKRHLDINLTGTFLPVHSVYKEMVKNKSGKIICIGSVSAQVGGVISGADYVASKGGVHSFIKSVAKEAAQNGIYINGVAPGPVASDMTEGTDYTAINIPLNRMGQPEDIAETALFLASPSSNFITGSVIDVNGGVNLR